MVKIVDMGRIGKMRHTGEMCRRKSGKEMATGPQTVLEVMFIASYEVFSRSLSFPQQIAREENAESPTSSDEPKGAVHYGMHRPGDSRTNTAFGSE
jgi:hypothetical protein